jgi:hypothetical protein
MRKSVTTAIHRGVRTVTTTITLDSSDQGTVIATNQTLVAMRYLNPPTVRGAAIFELIDDAVPNAAPRAIYRADLNSSSWMYPQNNSATFRQLIADANIQFGNLTVSKCPGGASIEVDVS